MDEYYKTWLRAKPAQPPSTPIGVDGEHAPVKVLSSKYDHYRQSLLEMDDREGWSSELRCYLNDRPDDVTKDTDIIKWWQDYAVLFPTLTWIALNILPCQASSVPCEQLFSASKQTADDRQASLGTKWFEELQLMKFAWRSKITDVASSNSDQVEVVDLGEYRDMLEYDVQEYEFEKDEDEFVIDD